ncbi:TPA: nicotinate phosphoribosyltransferase [Candidatus Uhrbacteria bacterium]|nr:MAG: hypothetical protein UT94_C0016G0013 [Candidatus Uhrbacteria bacterium GW2011_GWF2_40_263]OGL98212.1 MAG: nicotinate phosphoribosyltransferase [Candidatus Uhrbacteria bacterium RIFOXYB2_FULL_41_18]HBK35172.1 nicotinate phosphoribosyltransferase [Candidatus Uhrbacteria bacterium]HCB56042.1 nicotinate phosphoribosyltransferase [Candidatus Uhrbacteria bacterium]
MPQLRDASAFSPYIRASHTDLYQITMAYAYWKAGIHERMATYELFFRKCPFGGEYALFGGVADVKQLLQTFGFTTDEIAYFKTQLPHIEDAFWDYLATVGASEMTVWTMSEGNLVFPREPLVRVHGPQIVGQLLETPLLNICNYASLVMTNAARIRQAVGDDKKLLEGGLRRAQGPDGGLSASRYAYMGGFNASSNVLAGKLYGVPIGGTFAHAFVSSFQSLDQVPNSGMLKDKEGKERNFLAKVKGCRDALLALFPFADPHNGELAAFITYAMCYPDAFLALVDTYDTLKSGVVNFLAVAMALDDFGYQAKGIRLDSGDLAYLSRQARQLFAKAAREFLMNNFDQLKITASNDINEDSLYSMAQQGHEIDTFLVGTNLVTCEKQPAFGGVYKLVSYEGADGSEVPVMKISQSMVKILLSGSKNVYRLFLSDGFPVVDLICCEDEKAPQIGVPILCRHPFEESKRVRVVPARVERLDQILWDKGQTIELPNIHVIRDRALCQVASLREDHKRPLNPTPYKVTVSQKLYDLLHNLWQKNQPIETLT